MADKTKAKPKKNKNPSESALLTEYQGCQQYIDSAASRDWQIASIVWAAALAGLFFAAFDGHDKATAIITTFIAFVVIATLWIFSRMVARMVFFQKACMQRMREIELKLGMRRNIYFSVLDNWLTRETSDYWKDLSKDEIRNLEEKYLQKGRSILRLHTTTATYVINVLIMIAWVGMAAWKWLLYLNC